MKKIIHIPVWLLLATTAFGQQITPAPSPSFTPSASRTSVPPLTRADYLEKSQTQRRAAHICLIGGGALFAGGLIWGAASFANSNDFTTSDGAGILVVGGVLSMLGSIPLYIAAHRNARKARDLSASFKMEKGPVVQGSGLVFNSIPGLSLKLAL